MRWVLNPNENLTPTKPYFILKTKQIKIVSIPAEKQT